MSAARFFLCAAVAALFVSPFAPGGLRAGDAGPAKPFLHPLFSDHMVLQRDMRTSIWGWTTPGREVKVSIAGKTASATADSDGKWLARLDPLPAGGPYTLTVTGGQSVTLQDVLVGDVWLCSGQSNMTMDVRGSKDGPAEVAAADHPRIRLFTVPKYGDQAPLMHTGPLRTIAPCAWNVCSPKTVGNITAVGYFFARDLQGEINVPIGIIHDAVAGSSITAWCARPMLDQIPEIKPEMESLDTLKSLVSENKTGDTWFAGVMKDWWDQNDPGTREEWFKPDLDTGAWKKEATPAAGAKPGGLGYDGIVWCRVEVNVPPEWAGKDLKLFITGIYEPDTEWFNGVQVGEFGQGWANRTSTIPAKLVNSGRNVVALRVLTQQGHGYHGPAGVSSIGLAGGKPDEALPLDGDRLFCETTPRTKLSPEPRRLDNDFHVATVLYNGMIAPITPFALKGMIWYQGETPCPGGDAAHRKILAGMITDWRARFQSPDAWFLIVQLPVLGGLPTDNPSPDNVGCAGIRAVQWDVGHTVPNSDTAVIIDLGDPKDIHPANKQDVGKRLALIAQARIFGRPVEYSGPVFKSATVEGGAVRVTYDHLGGGLVVKGDKLDGFAISNDGRKWVWADAKVDGDNVVVSSPDAKSPKFLRYDYTDVPRYCLYNKAGLPAAPFDVQIHVPGS